MNGVGKFNKVFKSLFYGACITRSQCSSLRAFAVCERHILEEQMSSLALLVDMLPWLRSLGEAANSFPKDFPVAKDNVARGTMLIGEVNEFIARWEAVRRNA